jgi:uncharacterized RDD family membrane protein YckC
LAESFDAAAAQPAYGRFSRRLKAVVIDWMIIMLLLVAALFAAVSANSDRIGRILGFTVAVIWLLYEPLLVSLTGSTIGHYLTNLRVVDNRSHRNISFPKAVARVVIKGVLGLYSFVTMATTSRHQAVHDLLTQSTVQIRDLSKASQHHYVAERAELLSPAMPSHGRRVLVIVGYLAIAFVFAGLIMFGAMRANLLSTACLDHNRCSPSENLVTYGVSFGWIGLSVLCIIQGWRGRLFGGRFRAGST